MLEGTERGTRSVRTSLIWEIPDRVPDKSNSDTGGEFPAAVDEPEFGQDGGSGEVVTKVSDYRDEFATSVNSSSTFRQYGGARRPLRPL